MITGASFSPVVCRRRPVHLYNGIINECFSRSQKSCGDSHQGLAFFSAVHHCKHRASHSISILAEPRFAEHCHLGGVPVVLLHVLCNRKVCRSRIQVCWTHIRSAISLNKARTKVSPTLAAYLSKQELYLVEQPNEGLIAKS